MNLNFQSLTVNFCCVLLFNVTRFADIDEELFACCVEAVVKLGEEIEEVAVVEMVTPRRGVP